MGDAGVDEVAVVAAGAAGVEAEVLDVATPELGERHAQRQARRRLVEALAFGAGAGVVEVRREAESAGELPAEEELRPRLPGVLADVLRPGRGRGLDEQRPLRPAPRAVV